MSLNHAVCWAFFPSLRKYSFLNQVAQGSESFNGVKSYNKNALLALLPGAKQANQHKSTFLFAAMLLSLCNINNFFSYEKFSGMLGIKPGAAGSRSKIFFKHSSNYGKMRVE